MPDWISYPPKQLYWASRVYLAFWGACFAIFGLAGFGTAVTTGLPVGSHELTQGGQWGAIGGFLLCLGLGCFYLAPHRWKIRRSYMLWLIISMVGSAGLFVMAIVYLAYTPPANSGISDLYFVPPAIAMLLLAAAAPWTLFVRRNYATVPPEVRVAPEDVTT